MNLLDGYMAVTKVLPMKAQSLESMQSTVNSECSERNDADDEANSALLDDYVRVNRRISVEEKVYYMLNTLGLNGLLKIAFTK